jgi:hypothetical protein
LVLRCVRYLFVGFCALGFISVLSLHTFEDSISEQYLWIDMVILRLRCQQILDWFVYDSLHN